MSWNIHLIGTRAAVSTAVAQRQDVPMATSIAKYIAFAADPNPWVSLQGVGHDSNVNMLTIHFFTPAPESPADEAPEATPAPATTDLPTAGPPGVAPPAAA